MQSDCRGENRMTSMPNREMSNRLAPVAMSSMAQQASPIGIGQIEFLRNQLMAESTRVWITSPSIFESYPNCVLVCTESPSEHARGEKPNQHGRGSQVECVIFFT